MNRMVYDISMFASLAAIGAGAFIQWGAGIGLLVAGAVLAGFTVLGAVMGGGR